jgi:hypothetical protein
MTRVQRGPKVSFSISKTLKLMKAGAGSDGAWLRNRLKRRSVTADEVKNCLGGLG